MGPVDATYEDGVLRPTEPLDLRTGERVRLVVIRSGDPARWNLEALARGGEEEDRALSKEGLDAWTDALDAEDRG